jgi:di/tricarboxylate transporter
MALALATNMQMAPEPLVMAVALAASTAFATPVASPVNTMIVAPGHYKFMDFVRVGVPLQLVALVISVVLIPWIFPLTPV